MSESCENCHYGREIEDDDDHVSCRFFVPRVGEDTAPHVYKHYWCGGYKPREEKETL